VLVAFHALLLSLGGEGAPTPTGISPNLMEGSPLFVSRIFYINMDKHVDRRDWMETQLHYLGEGIPVSRFSGIMLIVMLMPSPIRNTLVFFSIGP